MLIILKIIFTTALAVQVAINVVTWWSTPLSQALMSQASQWAGSGY